MHKLFKQLVEKQLRYSSFFYKRLRAVQELEKADRRQIEAWREERLLRLILEAYQKSPFYRSLYDRHGVDINRIKSTRDLSLCPVITRQDIVESYSQIFIGSRLNRIKAKSSGTSGQSITVYRDYRSVIEEGAYQWAHRIRFGHHPGMKTVVIRGNLSAQVREQYDPFTKTLYLSSFCLNRRNASWYFDRIRSFAPNAIFAYPSSVESLANFLVGKKEPLRVPLIFTSSETLYSYQRQKITQVFDGRIVDWYGNAERTIALAERADGRYDQLPLYSVNEFRDDCIITTGLINASFPLIRYRVDDVVLPRPTDWQGKIDQIQGRSDDVLILPDGTRVGLICNAFDGIRHLQYSQVVQKDPATIRVNLVTTDAYSQSDEFQLVNQLRESIGEAPFSLHYVSEDKILRSRRGKFKLIVNEFAAAST
ncbi:MAG: hypothetical protein WA960_03005 [Tunicatimonas sp.]